MKNMKIHEHFFQRDRRVALRIKSSSASSLIKRDQSTFSHTHKVGNNGFNANFEFQYICSFLHYLYLKILVHLKLVVSW